MPDLRDVPGSADLTFLPRPPDMYISEFRHAEHADGTTSTHIQYLCDNPFPNMDILRDHVTYALHDFAFPFVEVDPDPGGYFREIWAAGHSSWTYASDFAPERHPPRAPHSDWSDETGIYSAYITHSDPRSIGFDEPGPSDLHVQINWTGQPQQRYFVSREG